MNIKKHIPNVLTCCNLLCGVIGIQMVVGLDIDFINLRYGLHGAIFCILLASVFDFLDGFAARLLNVSSPIGKELDSMADMVSFGVLPGFMMFQMTFVSVSDKLININSDNVILNYGGCIAFIAFLIPVFSAIRLAKFNVDTRQSDVFIGLPTPANTLFIAGLAYIYTQENNFLSFLVSPISLIVLSIFLSYLLIAELPLIALKFKSFGWLDNRMRYVLIISSILLLAILNFTAIPLIIILYIILSLIENKLVALKV
jgi:CDP-diacylglycerol--serine O-phosphatidyltransferase